MEANDMKAMREALENIVGYAETARFRTEDVHILSFLGEIEGWARSALAEPPRNCDVGTVEEQLDRYGFYCQSRCTSCDERHYCHICGERYRMECMMKWAQMPLRGRREVDGSK